MGKSNFYKPKNCKFDIGEIIEELQRENRERLEKYERKILEKKLSQEEANARYRKLKDAQRALVLLNKIQMGENQKSLELVDEDGERKNQNRFEPDV